MSNVLPISEIQKKLSISCGVSAESGRVTVRKYTWAGFLKKLREPIRTPETSDEYRAMSPKDKGRVKDVGYFIGAPSIDGGRSSKSFPEIEMLSLDADKAPRDWLALLKKGLPGEWCAYTTHSHRKHHPRVRILIPTRRAMTPAEHAYIIRVTAARIGEAWFDASGFRPTQPMFWPSVSSDGEYQFETAAGARLDPDSILAANPLWMDRRTWPIDAKAGESIGQRTEKMEDPTAKKGIVGAFCRAYDVAEALDTFLPGVYLPGDEDGRLTYAEGSTVNGAILYSVHEGGDWLYSHHGSDPIHGRLVNAFDLVRIHQFISRDEKAAAGTPFNRLPSFLAMSELARDDPKVRMELHKERLSTAAAEFSDIKNPDAWLSELHVNDKGVIRPTYLNCILIIENDEILKGCVSRNLFTGALDQRKALGKVEPGTWSEGSDGFLREFLERNYRIVFPSGTIQDALTGAAVKNPYHPIREWFGTLKWDGVKRAEKLFIDYLGAVDSRYSRAICRKMLLAAYWRVMVPGTKFDFVVILEGLQGGRKSTFWRAVAKDWFSELSTFDPKAAAEIILGCWFVEIAELDGFSRYEAVQLKSFFSKTRDRYREAYAVRALDRHRQCVFVGSTNDEEYLKDRTGNRRFWPIKCTKTQEDTIDIEGLEKVIDQVWAEVAELAKANEKLFLDGEDLRAAAEVEQGARLFVDEWQGAVEVWLDAPARIHRYQSGGDFSDDTERRARVCISEIWTECLHGDTLKMERKYSRRIGDILRALGWVSNKNQSFGKFGKQKCFEKDIPF